MINVREDRTMVCYQTFNVYDDKVQIGAVQCQGVCYGPSKIPNHRHHGPWITFIGPNNTDARNFGPRVDDFNEAITKVVERHNETLHGNP